jgi:hypothetical protein
MSSVDEASAVAAVQSTYDVGYTEAVAMLDTQFRRLTQEGLARIAVELAELAARSDNNEG